MGVISYYSKVKKLNCIFVSVKRKALKRESHNVLLGDLFIIFWHFLSHFILLCITTQLQNILCLPSLGQLFSYYGNF